MEPIELITKALEEVFDVKFTTETIHDDFLDQEKKQFTKMVNHLEKLVEHEHEIFEKFKIDLSTMTDRYWEMIEECLDFCLDEGAQEIVWWYIHDRKNAAGEIVSWEDEDGTEYTFNTPGDLYEFLLYKFNEIR